MQDNKQGDESILGNREIPKYATVKALNSLGATFNKLSKLVPYNLEHVFLLCHGPVSNQPKFLLLVKL